MKVAWLNDYKLDNYLGGAELTNHYWIEEGKRQGIDIEVITPETPIPNADHYVLTNCTKFNKTELARLKSFSIITHGQPHIPAEIYHKAKTACFMSPSHLERNKTLTDKGFYSPPYVDGKLFYPIVTEPVQRNLYIGWLYEHKGILNILDYAQKTKIPIDFYGKGDIDLINKIRIKGYEVYNEVPQEKLVDVYNKYDKFVWIIKRYGSYGRTLVEAMLCNKKLIIDSKNFGLFSYKWDFTSRDDIIQNLEKELQVFWNKLLDN